VPVDTHVWQIAARDYKFRLKGKKVISMTKDVYNGVGDFFRNLWGDYAGWAHSVQVCLLATYFQVLFTADLRVFRDYDGPDSVDSVETKTEEKVTEMVTPMKRKMEDIASTMDFPLTPPATIKSEKISFDLEIESDQITTKVTEHFVRRSKRRRIDSKDNPFD
jgi:N-glycosylase/DNA lyase